jgi:hypothetical protein
MIMGPSHPYGLIPINVIIPDDARQLQLSDVPAADDLKAVRLQVEFSGPGPVTLYSNCDRVRVRNSGAQVELQTTSPTIHYLAADAAGLSVKTLGVEKSSMAGYHDQYPRNH